MTNLSRKLRIVAAALILIGGFVFLGKSTAVELQAIGRKDELVLEGLINDYFYRRKIKDPQFFGNVDAYGSIVGKSIVVYVYAKHSMTANQSSRLREVIGKGLHEALLDCEDFNWAKKYSFDVILRER